MAEGTPVGRRVVLGLVGLGALGVAFGAGAQDAVQRAVANVSAGGALLPGGFRYYTVTSGFPERSPAAYRLRVDGLVEDAATFTFTDLAALPQTRLTQTFHCVTGWTVPDVRWTGVLVRDLLARVKPRAGARALRMYSFDGVYTESLTMAQAARPDTLLATGMQGKPVTSRHGGPVRMYVGSMYGYKGTKWLNRIEVVDRVVPGYWEHRGYDVNAWVGRSNGYG